MLTPKIFAASFFVNYKTQIHAIQQGKMCQLYIYMEKALDYAEISTR